jgi:importin-5
MDNRLAQSPGTYLVALAQFSVSADSDVVCALHRTSFLIMLIIPPQIRSFALVLLRRFMLRPVSDQPRPTTNAKGRHQTLSDQMTPAISGAIEDLLLHSFMHESSPSVRSASVETITALATNMRRKGRPWLALQPQAFGMTQNGNTAMRESAFRLLAGTRMLGVCGQTDSVMKVLNGGLEDESLDVSPFLIMFLRYPY